MPRGGARPNSGKKKGWKSSTTLRAMKAKEQLVAMFYAEFKPIYDALLEKARSGDIQAIKELFDRVWGKSSQPVTGEGGGDVIVRQVIVLDPETVKAYDANKAKVRK